MAAGFQEKSRFSRRRRILPRHWFSVETRSTIMPIRLRSRLRFIVFGFEWLHRYADLDYVQIVVHYSRSGTGYLLHHVLSAKDLNRAATGWGSWPDRFSLNPKRRRTSCLRRFAAPALRRSLRGSNG